TPLIGRSHLLAQLHAALDEVHRQRHNHVMLITGEAGLGKSRLVAEFRRSLQQSVPATRVYQGACLAYARSTPLWVVAAVLRDLMCLSAIDPENIPRELLPAHLNRVGLAAQDILPYLCNALGLTQIDLAAEARF